MPFVLEKIRIEDPEMFHGAKLKLLSLNKRAAQNLKVFTGKADLHGLST